MESFRSDGSTHLNRDASRRRRHSKTTAEKKDAETRHEKHKILLKNGLYSACANPLKPNLGAEVGEEEET